MKQAIIVLFILWVVLVLFMVKVRAGEVTDLNDFMGEQVYSVYLERSNYLHEVDS